MQATSMDRAVYKGGPANGTTCGIPANVDQVIYGNKPDQVVYNRTDRVDAMGRVILAFGNRYLPTKENA